MRYESSSRGECFVFIAQPEGPPEKPRQTGDVLYGEVLDVLPDRQYVVRVYCSWEPRAAVDVYDACCLNVRLARSQMDRARQQGWPPDVAWLRKLTAN